MKDGCIITVLGAGASVKCGFPLANDFFPSVKAFGESLGENCRQLRKVIAYVVAKAQDLDCLTPDDLALQMYQTRTGQNHKVNLDLLYYSDCH